MEKNKKYQLAVFLIGESESDKTWVANRLVNEFDFDYSISMQQIINNIATDPTIFNIQQNYFSPDLKDKDFPIPVKVGEAHIRRILRWLSNKIPDSMGINVMKMSVSNFSNSVLKKPNDVLQYIQYEIFDKISKDLFPMLNFNAIEGQVGNFVINDLKNINQHQIALQKLQFVYPVVINSADGSKKKIKNKDEPQPQYYLEESAWRNISTFTTIQNDKNIDKTDESIKATLEAINLDMNQKIKTGQFPILSKNIYTKINDYSKEVGPLGQNKVSSLNRGAMQSGKAVFEKGNPDTERPTSQEDIQLYHQSGTIDRSALKAR